jgi:hypothetical protein
MERTTKKELRFVQIATSATQVGADEQSENLYGLTAEGDVWYWGYVRFVEGESEYGWKPMSMKAAT